MGLDTVMFLSKNAEVLLTFNLWAEVGLCNNSFRVVEQFWYTVAAGPPSLPIAVLVHFPGYTGPGSINTCEKYLSMPPKVFEWQVLVTTTNPIAIEVCNDQGWI